MPPHATTPVRCSPTSKYENRCRIDLTQAKAAARNAATATCQAHRNCDWGYRRRHLSAKLDVLMLVAWSKGTQQHIKRCRARDNGAIKTRAPCSTSRSRLLRASQFENQTSEVTASPHTASQVRS